MPGGLHRPGEACKVDHPQNRVHRQAGKPEPQAPEDSEGSSEPTRRCARFTDPSAV
jgi:hypothetical protein